MQFSVRLDDVSHVEFALIKTKCLPILLYGTEICPTYSANLQSMQFTINRVIIKLVGLMPQNCYKEVSHYFGIKSVKELICNHFEKFIMSYSVSDNCLCRLISTRCWICCDLARSANLPEGLYILPMFFRYFFIFLMVDVLALVAQTLMEQSSPKFQDW